MNGLQSVFLKNGSIPNGMSFVIVKKFTQELQEFVSLKYHTNSYEIRVIKFQNNLISANS